MRTKHIITGVQAFDVLHDAELCGQEGADGVKRIAEASGSHPEDVAEVSVQLGSDTRHVFIHDVGNVEWWAGNEKRPNAGRLYDVIAINNGWFTPEDQIRKSGRHGWGLYTQNWNSAPVKEIDTCVFIAGLGYAFKIYLEAMQNKVANYHIRNTIFVDDHEVYIGGVQWGAEDIIIEDCIFDVSTLRFGYRALNRRLTLRRCIIIGRLNVGMTDGLVLEDNVIITRDPKLSPIDFESFAVNLTIKGNVLYTDNPKPFNGMTKADWEKKPGMGVRNDTQVLPLAQAPAFVRAFPVEGFEYPTANVFVYNPGGSPSNALPDGWDGARVHDVRRYGADDQPYSGSAFTMSGVPTAPLNWDFDVYGAAPIPTRGFPHSGVFRIEMIEEAAPPSDPPDVPPTPPVDTEPEEEPDETPDEDAGRIAELEQQLAEAAAAAAAVIAERDSALAAISEKDSQISNLGVQLAEKDQAIRTLEAEIEALQAHVARGTRLADAVAQAWQEYDQRE